METRPPDSALPVSVVIPAYNKAEMLERALESVAEQRPAPAAEIIVVDDASDDETGEVAMRMGARVVRHSRNLGTAAARNTGVKAAAQPWIALLDHDDEWLPHHLSEVWNLRDSHLLVAGSALRCGPDPLDDRLQGAAGPEPLRLSPDGLIFPGNVVPASAALVRRDVIEAVGGFRPPDGVNDLDMWVRVLERGTGIVSPAVTVIYRVHAAQESRQIPAMQEGHIAVANRYVDRPWWSKSLLERWRALAAWNNLRSAVRKREPLSALRSAAWIAARPQRLRGAISASVHRAQMRRRGATTARDGGPSVALLSRRPELRARAATALNGRPVVDLANRRSRLNACLRLFRRPTACAVASSRGEAMILRAAGVRQVIRLDRLTGAPPWEGIEDTGHSYDA